MDGQSPPHLNAGVTRVSPPPVLPQLLPTVELPFVTEQVNVGHADVAVEELDAREMIVQLLEGLERDAGENRRLVAQQL